MQDISQGRSSLQKIGYNKNPPNHSRSPSQSKQRASRSLTPNKSTKDLKSEIWRFSESEKMQQGSKLSKEMPIGEIAKNLLDLYEKDREDSPCENADEKERFLYKKLISSLNNLSSLKSKIAELFEAVQKNETSQCCLLCGCNCKGKSYGDTKLPRKKYYDLDLTSGVPKMCLSCKNYSLFPSQSKKRICSYCENSDNISLSQKLNSLSLFLEISTLNESVSTYAKKLNSKIIKVESINKSAQVSLETPATNLIHLTIPWKKRVDSLGGSQQLQPSHMHHGSQIFNKNTNFSIDNEVDSYLEAEESSISKLSRNSSKSSNLPMTPNFKGKERPENFKNFMSADNEIYVIIQEQIGMLNQDLQILDVKGICEENHRKYLDYLTMVLNDAAKKIPKESKMIGLIFAGMISLCELVIASEVDKFKYFDDLIKQSQLKLEENYMLKTKLLQFQQNAQEDQEKYEEKFAYMKNLLIKYEEILGMYRRELENFKNN
ncbi:unnamed protein product [Blepharisma stoltei]|uniref:Uncharacterized protein n=1 Tax=Blepharisma stoltei TaxID=1481888 RepID=A0AAU9J1H8_9CILI|nr:unnamed protein product [Blepharisma stoltei]